MNRMISFGYGFADGKLSVIAEEAETVKGIFSDYVNGKILKEIADDLTARQVNFFNGKCSWNKNMIFRIIENGKYIGEDGYPAILPIALFERANLIKKQKSKVKIELSEETETLKNMFIAVNAVGCYIVVLNGEHGKSGIVFRIVNAKDI